jgi:hypothetical protein
MVLIFIIVPPVLAAAAGWLVAPAYLHPIRRELTPDLIVAVGMRDGRPPLQCVGRPKGRSRPTAGSNATTPVRDYAGLRKFPWLGKTLLRPFAWTLMYRGERLTGIPLEEISSQKAVARFRFF